MPSMRLYRFSIFVWSCVLVLILAGGLVTSKEAGLAVPDWPLSYGRLMPPMVGGIRYEHTHRMIAAGAGLMTLVLTFWLLAKEKRTWVRWVGIAAFGAVVTQGILGALTVQYLLPPPISIFHACLAQTFFTLVVWLSFATSKEWFSHDSNLKQAKAEGLKRPLIMLIALIYLQLILGATLRHTANHLIVISHIVNGFLVLIHAGVVMMKAFQNDAHDKTLTQPAFAIGFLALIQMSLGMGAFVYVVMLTERLQPQAWKIFFVTAHQSLGALLLALSVFVLLRVLRRGESS